MMILGFAGIGFMTYRRKEGLTGHLTQRREQCGSVQKSPAVAQLLLPYSDHA